MNSLDLPAPPPPGGRVMTLSEAAGHLVESFQEDAKTDEELGRKIGAAIDYLLTEGLLREWGFNEERRTVYAADAAFEFDTRPSLNLPLPPQTQGQTFYMRIWYE